MVTEHIEAIRRHCTFILHSRSTSNPVDEHYSYIDDYLKRQEEADLLRAKLQERVCHLEKEVQRLQEQLQCERVVASNETSGLKRKRTDELFEDGGIRLDDPAQYGPAQYDPVQILSTTMQQEAARVQLMMDGLELSNPAPRGMSSELELMTSTNS